MFDIFMLCAPTTLLFQFSSFLPRLNHLPHRSPSRDYYNIAETVEDGKYKRYAIESLEVAEYLQDIDGVPAPMTHLKRKKDLFAKVLIIAYI